MNGFQCAIHVLADFLVILLNHYIWEVKSLEKSEQQSQDFIALCKAMQCLFMGNVNTQTIFDGVFGMIISVLFPTVSEARLSFYSQT